MRKTIHFPCRTPPAHPHLHANVQVARAYNQQQISPRLIMPNLATSEGAVELNGLHGIPQPSQPTQQHTVQRGISCETRLVSSAAIVNALRETSQETVQMQPKRSSVAECATITTQSSLRNLSPVGLYPQQVKTIYDVPRSPPMRTPRERSRDAPQDPPWEASQAALQEVQTKMQPQHAKSGKSPRGSSWEPPGKPLIEQIRAPLKVHRFEVPSTAATPQSQLRSLSPTSAHQFMTQVADVVAVSPERSPSWEQFANTQGEQIWPPKNRKGLVRSAISTSGSTLRTVSPPTIQSRRTTAEPVVSKIHPPTNMPEGVQIGTTMQSLEGIDENESSTPITSALKKKDKEIYNIDHQNALSEVQLPRQCARPGKQGVHKLNARLEAQNARLEAQNLCLEARNKNLEVVVSQLLERVGSLEERLIQ